LTKSFHFYFSNYVSKPLNISLNLTWAEGNNNAINLKLMQQLLNM